MFVCLVETVKFANFFIYFNRSSIWKKMSAIQAVLPSLFLINSVFQPWLNWNIVYWSFKLLLKFYILILSRILKYFRRIFPHYFKKCLRTIFHNIILFLLWKYSILIGYGLNFSTWKFLSHIHILQILVDIFRYYWFPYFFISFSYKCKTLL